MNVHSIFRQRQLALAATAAFTFGIGSVVTAAGAGASPERGTRHAIRSATVRDDTLTITGSPHADRLALRLAAGNRNTLELVGTDGTVTQAFDRTTFSHIDVFLLSGNDEFTVDQTNGAFADEALTVDGGPGADTLFGGDGNDLLIGGPGNDSVDGKKGADTALLGTGNDVFVWDPGEGSDVIAGGPGTDTMVFNGAGANETMALRANGAATVFTRDVGTIRMDMVGVENLDLAARGGSDTITVGDLTGTGFRQANVDLGGPDHAKDVVTVEGTNGPDAITVGANGQQVVASGLPTETRVSGIDATDELHISARDGNDAVTVGADASALIGVLVDLGAGQL